MIGQTRTLRSGGIHLPNTLQPIGAYRGDPTHRSAAGTFAKAVLTPDGPGTMRLWWNRSGDVTAEAWGAGTDWLLGTADRWVGLTDDLSGFDPTLHPKVARWWRESGNFRLSSLGVIWQELVLSAICQRVTTQEAIRSWKRMCCTWGAPAPGPCELQLPPTPERIVDLTYHDLHKINVERRRAEAIMQAAHRANRLEEAVIMSTVDALARLTAVPGLGVWTATTTLISSHGDPDVIVLGDYGMPTKVNYAFTGDAARIPPDAGGDEVMCELLEPWRGHRQRIVRLLFAAKVNPPRHGPRAFNPDIRRI